MARAYQCDRCGEFCGSMKQKVDQIFSIWRDDEETMDLCPACYKDLLTFINGGIPNAEEEED